MLNFEKVFEFNDKSNDVLAIGEILVDMISEEYDDNFNTNTYRRYFGGSPSNIAMNVKKLGINSIVTSAVGNDGFGDFLIDRLQKEEIDTSHIQRVDYATSMVLVTKSKATPKPIFYREADYHLEYNEKLSNAIKNSKIIHFSCWPITRTSSQAVIRQCINEAKAHNVLVCFDPNYHIGLWPKGEDGLDQLKGIIKMVDIVKPSIEDAERIFGKRSVEEYIDEFLKLGVKLVIFTLGAEGAIVSNGKETIKFDTFATKVEDTTGAGDAFWSGFYTAIVKGYPIKKAFEFGFAVSAYKLQYTGAVVDLPSLEKIKQIYNL
ncbi:sugar kinase [Globicatella sulfidifaciens]|uniref:Sugar kinase n=1 Tax=Globicatella sulfidifaciens TaxID=136093 RepID=A0A7X8H0S8_9LACT|nr:sugar kinase [Globicatella sulfidifaciens]NLJ18912.1 sugar kinase [Globicatella sulfidifaciens]